MADGGKVVELAKEWLLNSGIQNVGKEKEINGGFNSWFNLSEKKYQYIYSEVTGYGISTLIYLNKLNLNKNFIERSKLSADWLIKFAMHESGGIKTRYYYDKNDEQKEFSFDDGLLFTFDSGMVLYGLIMLYKETKEEKYLNAATKIADFLIKCIKKDGFFYAAYNPKRDDYVDDEKKWSFQSGSFHSKIALGLLELHEITGEKSYKISSIDICNSAMKVQEKNGRFITSRENNSTHFHPHLYSAEGMMYVGMKLEKRKFLESAAAACKWTLESQNENGGIPCMFVDGKFNKNERTDVLSQTLRLSTILLKMKILNDENIKEKLDKLMKRVVNLQNTDNEQAGGFFFGWDENGNEINHLNSWCTMFSIQALNMYDDFFLKKKSFEIMPFI